MSSLGKFARGGGGTLAALVATCGLMLGSQDTAYADPRADQLAADAKAAMFAEPPRYADAIDLYNQAIVLSPEGKFYFNLCVAYYSIGEFGLALEACDSVERAGADAKLMEKNAKILKQVEDQIRAMGGDPEKLRNPDTGGGGDGGDGGGDGSGDGSGDPIDGGGGGGDGSGGSGGGGEPVDDPNSFKGAPPPSLFAAKPPSHDYTWTLGGSLFGASSSVGSSSNMYAGGGVGFRLHADYMLVPQRRVGIQGYLGLTTIGPSDPQGEALDIVDFGLAGYIHAWCKGRMCITPLLGAHIGGMQPEGTGDMVRMATVGIRAEAGLSYSLGRRYEHVISFTPGLNFYLPAVGDYDIEPETYGLDQAGTTVYFGLGYTHRFDTPFGQAPFITLE